MLSLPLTNALKEQILQYKKKGLDIASLIQNVNIKGADLSGTFISYLDASDQDISGTNFANCKIGTADTVVNFNRTILDNCCFVGTTFPGVVWIRRARARNCNFERASFPFADYRYCDFRGSKFCDSIFSIGTEKGYGAVFDENFFKELAKYWGVTITITGIEGKSYGGPIE